MLTADFGGRPNIDDQRIVADIIFLKSKAVISMPAFLHQLIPIESHVGCVGGVRIGTLRRLLLTETLL